MSPFEIHLKYLDDMMHLFLIKAMARFTASYICASRAGGITNTSKPMTRVKKQIKKTNKNSTNKRNKVQSKKNQPPRITWKQP